MSDDDIPEELREGGEGMSDEQEQLIIDCVKRNEPGVSVLGISPTDKLEYFKGNHEQQYSVRVFRPTNGGEERGVVMVDLRQDADGWSASFVSSSL